MWVDWVCPEHHPRLQQLRYNPCIIKRPIFKHTICWFLVYCPVAQPSPLSSSRTFVSSPEETLCPGPRAAHLPPPLATSDLCSAPSTRRRWCPVQTEHSTRGPVSAYLPELYPCGSTDRAPFLFPAKHGSPARPGSCGSRPEVPSRPGRSPQNTGNSYVLDSIMSTPTNSQRNDHSYVYNVRL